MTYLSVEFTFSQYPGLSHLNSPHVNVLSWDRTIQPPVPTAPLTRTTLSVPGTPPRLSLISNKRLDVLSISQIKKPRFKELSKVQGYPWDHAELGCKPTALPMLFCYIVSHHSIILWPKVKMNSNKCADATCSPLPGTESMTLWIGWEPHEHEMSECSGAIIANKTIQVKMPPCNSTSKLLILDTKAP